MMQPAESLVRKNATRSFRRNPAVRCSLPESEMGAIVVVVADIFGDQPSQMTFIQGNDVIQQIELIAGPDTRMASRQQRFVAGVVVSLRSSYPRNLLCMARQKGKTRQGWIIGIKRNGRRSTLMKIANNIKRPRVRIRSVCSARSRCAGRAE
jgi:hypothetical protein